MHRKKVDLFTEKLVANNICNEKDKQIISFGIAAFLELLLNILTTVILGCIFNLLLEVTLFMALFIPLRSYAGGYHCKSAFNCYLLSSGIIVLVLAVLKYIQPEHIFVIIVIFLPISVGIILKYAPVETKSKPLDETEQKYFRKKAIQNLVIEVVASMALYIFNFKIYSFTVTLAITLSAVLVVLGMVDNKISKATKAHN